MASRQTSSKSKLFAIYAAIMIPVGVALNYVGSLLNSALGIPLYLDSVGTAVASAAMGPWVGAACGLLYSIISALTGDSILYVLFGICNIGTGLIIGFMMRKGSFEKWWKALILVNIIVSVWSAASGYAVASAVFNGTDISSGATALIAALQAKGMGAVIAGFLGRLVINLADKGISLLIAWLVYKKLPGSIRNFAKK